MKKSIKTFEQAQKLEQSEMTKTKGGLLLTCEEKRGSFLGIPVTYNQWSLRMDSSPLWLNVRM
jgi:hypothetical protein